MCEQNAGKTVGEQQLAEKRELACLIESNLCEGEKTEESRTKKGKARNGEVRFLRQGGGAMEIYMAMTTNPYAIAKNI